MPEQLQCPMPEQRSVPQVLWGALFVLAVLVRDAETAADAAAIDAIASTGMLYVLQRIRRDYQVWIAGTRTAFCSRPAGQQCLCESHRSVPRQLECRLLSRDDGMQSL